MADRLETYEFTGPGRGYTYPWDEWTDGSSWRVVGGEDYRGKAVSFRANLYRVAKVRDLTVQSEIERDQKGEPVAVVFRFTKEG